MSKRLAKIFREAETLLAPPNVRKPYHLGLSHYCCDALAFVVGGGKLRAAAYESEAHQLFRKMFKPKQKPTIPSAGWWSDTTQSDYQWRRTALLETALNLEEQT